MVRRSSRGKKEEVGLGGRAAGSVLSGGGPLVYCFLFFFLIWLPAVLVLAFPVFSLCYGDCLVPARSLFGAEGGNASTEA